MVAEEKGFSNIRLDGQRQEDVDYRRMLARKIMDSVEGETVSKVFEALEEARNEILRSAVVPRGINEQLDELYTPCSCSGVLTTPDGYSR